MFLNFLQVKVYLYTSFQQSITEYTPQTKTAFNFVQKQVVVCSNVFAILLKTEL